MTPAPVARPGPPRPGNGRPEAGPGPAATETETPEPEAVIRCRACGEPITRRAWAIRVRDGHEHTVFNPAGLVFHIGCFAEAPGAWAFGPRSTVFTWFPGYAWTVTACAGCGRHLGWLYLRESGAAGSATGPPAFHGLILDRLAEGAGEEGPSPPA